MDLLNSANFAEKISFKVFALPQNTQMCTNQSQTDKVNNNLKLFYFILHMQQNGTGFLDTVMKICFNSCQTKLFSIAMSVTYETVELIKTANLRKFLKISIFVYFPEIIFCQKYSFLNCTRKKNISVFRNERYFIFFNNYLQQLTATQA